MWDFLIEMSLLNYTFNLIQSWKLAFNTRPRLCEAMKVHIRSVRGKRSPTETGFNDLTVKVLKCCTMPLESSEVTGVVIWMNYKNGFC